jgi:L-asparaginase/Glu-tRNA(Gln) amidotransferase subunit D
MAVTAVAGSVTADADPGEQVRVVTGLPGCEDDRHRKARVLLMLAMTITKDVTEIQQMFEHN